MAARAAITLVRRDRTDVERFLGDWGWSSRVSSPSWTDWRPETEPDDSNGAYYWAGVARKP